MSTINEKPSESEPAEKRRVTLVVVVDCEVDDVAAAQLVADRIAQTARHRDYDGARTGFAAATVAECDAKEFVASLGAAVARTGL
jgi:hypothetical protein